MLVTTKLLCSAAAAAIAACTYVNLPTIDSTPAKGHASFTAEEGGRPVDAMASPHFPDGAPAAVCPWNPCDIGAMFSMGAR